MKIIILGASGFIGSHIFNYCVENGIGVIGTYAQSKACDSLIQFDFCQNSFFDFYSNIPHREEYDTVVLCSAISSIDYCKRNISRSYELNVTRTIEVINQINELGMKTVFLSSEAVFDGKKGLYKEEDIPNPLSVYGKQKVSVEQYVKNNIKNHLILRISRAVGNKFGENDILNDFYSKIIAEEDIVCLREQSFCLTYIGDISEIIIQSIEESLTGLYHLSSDNYISRYQLALRFADKIFGKYEKIYERNFAELGFLDARHIYGGLNGNRLCTRLNCQFKTLDEIFNAYHQSYRRTLCR